MLRSSTTVPPYCNPNQRHCTQFPLNMHKCKYKHPAPRATQFQFTSSVSSQFHPSRCHSAFHIANHHSRFDPTKLNHSFELPLPRENQSTNDQLHIPLDSHSPSKHYIKPIPPHAPLLAVHHKKQYTPMSVLPTQLSQSTHWARLGLLFGTRFSPESQSQPVWPQSPPGHIHILSIPTFGHRCTTYINVQFTTQPSQPPQTTLCIHICIPGGI